jgi:solute carrier family 13 (sodium-dependent dicarboxylate transporter), member 2/3/5
MNNSPYSLRQRIGFWVGIPLAVILLWLPTLPGLSSDGQKVLCIAILMALWWITEAIPLYATALIPLVAFPLLGIMKAGDLASSYGHHYIYLFMGGFFLAKAIEKWNLHERIALQIISIIGASPKRIILGIMMATAFLSMWISDTASTMVMFPIGLAILYHVEASVTKTQWQDDLRYRNFSSCLIVSIAYAALIGGIATLIGTPPNIVFAGAIKTLYPDAPEITFFQWMKVGLPLTVIFLPLTWFYLTRIALPVHLAEIPGGEEVIQEKKRALGKMSKGERYTLFVFIGAIFGWVFRKNIEVGTWIIPGWSNLLGLEKHVHDSTVAMMAALLLFIIPADLKKGEFLLDWNWAKQIPWGILILFGGGIALAAAVKSSGLSQWIGKGLSILSGFPLILIVLGVCLMMTFMTEITSNTAISTVFMPIMASIAVAMQVNPMLFMIPAALSASCAFMLPVATPPNAIVFSSGYITAPQMARTGIGLNLIGAVLITLAIYLLAIPVFGITLTGLPPWALN